MTFTEFLVKYNGKYVDWDGAYGPQCVDLMRQYLLEVLCVPNESIKPVVGAKDMYEKFESIVDATYFDKYPNTPTAIPKEGDILIWNNGTYGHVAIYVDGDVNRFRSFDQNYPTGTPCHIQEHNYTSLAGWLRCKKDSMNADLEACRIDRDRNWTYFSGLCDVMGVTHNFDIAKAELEKLVKIEDVVREKEKEIEEKNQKLEEIKTEASLLKKELSDLSTGITEAQTTIAEQKQKLAENQFALEGYEATVVKLNKRLEELESTKPLTDMTAKELFFELLKKLLGRG